VSKYAEAQQKLRDAISHYKATGGSPAYLTIADLEILLAMSSRLNMLEPFDGAESQKDGNGN
jgi:hypothetical protein